MDFPGNAIHQAPGYRDWNFFIDPSSFLKLDLFNAHYYSLWAGTYYSWFFDGHNALVPVQESSKIGIVLIILSIPLFIVSILGFITELKNISKKNRILFIYPLFLFLSYIAYNFKLPFYSTVKAIFLSSTVIPWIYFVISGIKIFLKKSESVTKAFIILFLLIYLIVIIKNFWIIGWWYNYLK